MAVVFSVAFHAYVVHEERHLELVFGDVYRRYRERTPRYVGVTRG